MDAARFEDGRSGTCTKKQEVIRGMVERFRDRGPKRVHRTAQQELKGVAAASAIKIEPQDAEAPKRV